MPTANLSTLNKSVTVGGESFQEIVTIDADNKESFEPVGGVPAAKTGSLTTRTDNTTGTLTMSAGHGINTGNRLDIFFDGGCRYGVVVGTVAVNSVPFSGGGGDNLPVATTPITAAVPHEEPFVVTGDNVAVLAVKCPQQSVFVFTDASDAAIFAIPLDEGGAYSWTSEDNASNPLAGGAVAKVYMSHALSTAAARMNGSVLFD